MTENEDPNKNKDGQSDDAKYCQSTASLKAHLNSGAEKILNSASSEKFVQLYKSLFKEFRRKDDIHTRSLSGSSVEAKKYWNCSKEFLKLMISETVDDTVSNMDSKFKEFEELKKQQANSTVLWRPPGNATLHLNPFECVIEVEKKKKLVQQVHTVQETVTVLKGRLIQKRNKVKELEKVLLSSLNAMEKIICDKVGDEKI